MFRESRECHEECPAKDEHGGLPLIHVFWRCNELFFCDLGVAFGVGLMGALVSGLVVKFVVSLPRRDPGDVEVSDVSSGDFQVLERQVFV